MKRAKHMGMLEFSNVWLLFVAHGTLPMSSFKKSLMIQGT